MQSRCCWPPERARALFLSRSLTSSQRAAPLQRLLDLLVEVAASADDAQAVGHVLVDRLREGVGLLEDHADAPAHLRPGRRLRRGDPDAVVAGSRPSIREPGIRSFMRLRQRRTVRLAAAGGADDRRHHPLVDLEGHVPHRRRRAVMNRQPIDGEDGSRASVVPGAEAPSWVGSIALGRPILGPASSGARCSGTSCTFVSVA